MRNILFIALLSIIAISCSDDTEALIQPNVKTISDVRAKIGDLFTINGNDFNENGTYIVKFNDVQSKVKEIKNTYLKVEIPEDATSGEITLTYDNKTTKIGTIIITKFPTIESISPEKAIIGNTISITGTNFVLEETYVVKFQEIEAKIIEVSTTKLIVEVPEGATSGEVSIIYENETKMIGSITILQSYLYAYKRDYSGDNSINQIVRINKQTGNEEVIATLNLTTNYYNDLVYDPSTKNIIGLDRRNLVKVNIETGDFSSVAIPVGAKQDVKELVLDEHNNLYVLRRDYSGDNSIGSIIKLNKETGVIESVVATSEKIYNFNDVVYSSNNKTIYGVSHRKSIVSVNIENGEIRTDEITLGNSQDFQELIIDNNDNLYGFKRDYSGDNGIGEIIKINKENISLDKSLVSSEGIYRIEDIIFDRIGNNIIVVNNEYFSKIDIETGLISNVKFAFDKWPLGDYNELVIVVQ